MSETLMLKSPVTGQPLQEISVQDITLFKDPDTGGYWLRFESLQALADLQATPLEEVYTGEIKRVHQGRFCPEDNTPLEEFEFEEHSNVKVDYCPTCNGLWLDAGELTQLLAYLEAFEFGDHLRHDHEHEPHLSQRVMLFLYQLIRYPPMP